MKQFTKEELIVIHNRCLIPTVRFAEMFDENLCADDFTVSIDLWEKLENSILEEPKEYSPGYIKAKNGLSKLRDIKYGM